METILGPKDDIVVFSLLTYVIYKNGLVENFNYYNKNYKKKNTIIEIAIIEYLKTFFKFRYRKCFPTEFEGRARWPRTSTQK